MSEYTPPLTDEEHAAHQQVLPGVNPDAVIEAMENPEVFEEIARADLYVQMAHLREQARHPDFSTSARMDYVKMLSRMGKVAEPARDGFTPDNLPGINIVLPNSGGHVNIGVNPGSAGAFRPPAAEKTEKDVSSKSQHIEHRPSKAVLP